VPVPTGALIKLIERDAHELKLYADLTKVEEGLLGVTFFDPPARSGLPAAYTRTPLARTFFASRLPTSTSTCGFRTRSISGRGARSARSSAARRRRDARA
jgi:hypothetical protein